jgi:hypothetical protein
MQINPKGVGICRRLLKSCNPLGHPTILIDGIEVRTWRVKKLQHKKLQEKAQGGFKELTLQLLAS